jgi:SOS-response transcriptional repressor LexA
MESKEARRHNLLLLEEQFRSLAELERRTDGEVTASYLSQVKNQYRKMGDDVARRLERALDKAVGWMDQPQASLVAREPNVEEFRRPRSRLPLVSWVLAGNRGEVNDPYAPGAAESWVEFDSAASRSAFCLRVRGDSMVRADGSGFPDGCLIAVEPSRRARSGDFVVVRFNDSDEATFKQYFIEGMTKYLKPLNPAYPTLGVPPDAHMVGVVFEKRVIEKF